MLFGPPLLVVAVLLAWYAGSGPGLQPTPEPVTGPDGRRTEPARVFADQFPGDTASARAVINGRAFNLEVASDTASRGLGLGGRDELADDSAMLFVFPGEGFHGFWMKDVSFPLDLIYIAGDGTIMDIQTMEPEPDVPDADLTIYEPPVKVLLAMEISGGLSRRLGIEAGMAVEFE